MKTKRISFKKAALPVFGMLFAAIIALTSVTYAWFTSGTTATVSPINIGVEAAGGLQIAMGSSEGFNWMSTLTVEAANGYTLSPASTNGEATGTAGSRTLSFFSARYSDTFDKITDISAAGNTDKSKAGYITFDLYFRNPELTEKNVNLVGTTVTSLAGQSNEAVRIAFVKQAEISSAQSNQNLSAFGTPKATYSDNAIIFEPNATSHTGNGLTDYGNNKNGGTQKPGVKYEYKALTKVDNTGAMFDRFTGEKYVAESGSDARSFDKEFTTDQVVFDSSSTGGVTKFRKWNMKDDFTTISPDEAGTLFGNGTPVYIETEEDGKYSYELNEAEIQKEGVQYALFTPVKLYTVSEGDVLTEDDVTTYEIKDAQENNNITYFTLSAQSVTKVTVYIWLEGQDVDCNNTVAGYQFDVNLSFGAETKA